MKKRGRSLRSTIFNVTTIPILVLSLIFTTLFLISAYLLMLEIRGRQNQVAKELAGQANLYLNETGQLAELLAAQLNNQSPTQQTTTLMQVRRQYPRFTALYVLNQNGVVISEDTVALPLLGLDLSREDIYRQALTNEHVAISRPFISATTGNVAITVAAPIWSRQGNAQMFMAEMDLTLLQHAIEQVGAGMNSISFIVDATGVLVAYPDAQWVQERRNLNNLSLVQEGMSGRSGFRAFTSPLWGHWMAGSVTPMAHHWSVVILQPVRAIAQPLIFLVSLSLLALIISILVIFVLITRGVRRATGPIIALAQEVEGLSEGHYHKLEPATTPTFREVNSLRKSFAGMVEAVIERDQLLEQRVADRTHRIKTLAAISEHLTSILDLDTLLNEVVNQIHANFDYPHVSIFLLEDDNLRIRAASGPAGQELLAEHYLIPLVTARSLVAHAARTGKIVNEVDIHTTPQYMNCEHLPQTQSEMCVPIIGGEQVIGIIDVQTTESHSFDSTEIDTFRSLANQVGIAIHNAQLYSKMENLVVERTSELTISNQELNSQLAERKRVEGERESLLLQVREQANQVREIMNSVPEAVLLLDGDGCLMMTNLMAEEMLPALCGLPVGTEGGRCLDHIGNRSLPDLLVEDPGELWHEIKAQSRTFEAISRPVDHDNSVPQRFVMVIREVTAERVVQQQVQQQERLAAVGQLAAGIAHDFNNIMAVILLYIDIMLNLPDLQPRHRERLNTIAQQAHRAADLIQQILDFSRRSVLERRPMDITPLVKEQVKLLERTFPENITLRVKTEDGPITVNADPTRLQQAVMNLALNARDAMPEGGRIDIQIRTVVAGQEPVRCINCGDVLSGNWVCISVQDSGPGVPEEIAGRIFEPFFTTKAPGKGTGLGLAQVYGIAKQHEGHIELRNFPGQGSCFNMYLPLVKTSRTFILESDQGAPVKGEGQLLLVVEDEPVTRKAIVDGLNQLNYRTVAVNNGREALEAVAQYHNEVRLVLSDVIMPEMSGIAMFRLMRQRGIKLPVILMSGHPLHEEMEKLQSEGVVGWLSKPPNMERLSRIVALALRQVAAGNQAGPPE